MASCATRFSYCNPLICKVDGACVIGWPFGQCQLTMLSCNGSIGSDDPRLWYK